MRAARMLILWILVSQSPSCAPTVKCQVLAQYLTAGAFAAQAEAFGAAAVVFQRQTAEMVKNASFCLGEQWVSSLSRGKTKAKSSRALCKVEVGCFISSDFPVFKEAHAQGLIVLAFGFTKASLTRDNFRSGGAGGGGGEAKVRQSNSGVVACD